jgi:hypothetical protein
MDSILLGMVIIAAMAVAVGAARGLLSLLLRAMAQRGMPAAGSQ